jgi:hypothetical protein
MVIEFRPSAFMGDFKSLNHLFQICTFKQRYNVYADLVTVKDLDNFIRLDSFDKEILSVSFNAQMTAQRSEDKRGKSISNADYFIDDIITSEKNVFNLNEGIAFFAQKVTLILENSHNDAYFVKALIKYFDDSGKLKRHLQNTWFAFDNAGGCTNVKNHITEKLEEFNALNKENHYYYRAFVLLDSDRKSPDQDLNYKHTELLKFLDDKHIKYHVLEKRMMENYMPEDVIETYSDNTNKDWINAFKYLSRRQKDFVDFTKGFSSKNGDGSSKRTRDQIEEDVKELFKDVSDKNYSILDRGLKLANFKNNFPANFMENGRINAANLQALINHQDDPDEYNTILNKITSLI